jgi:hypothetical protein
MQFKNNLYWDFNTLSPGTVDVADPLFPRANALKILWIFHASKARPLMRVSMAYSYIFMVT